MSDIDRSKAAWILPFLAPRGHVQRWLTKHSLAFGGHGMDVDLVYDHVAFDLLKVAAEERHLDAIGKDFQRMFGTNPEKERPRPRMHEISGTTFFYLSCQHFDDPSSLAVWPFSHQNRAAPSGEADEQVAHSVEAPLLSSPVRLTVMRPELYAEVKKTGHGRAPRATEPYLHPRLGELWDEDFIVPQPEGFLLMRTTLEADRIEGEDPLRYYLCRLKV